jgi:hypothetical protein
LHIGLTLEPHGRRIGIRTAHDGSRTILAFVQLTCDELGS